MNRIDRLFAILLTLQHKRRVRARMPMLATMFPHGEHGFISGVSLIVFSVDETIERRANTAAAPKLCTLFSETFQIS